MKQQCIDAITRAIGRKPLADEIRNIEQGINDAVRTIRVKNAQSGTVMPDSQVYAEAAKLAGQRAVHSIYKKRQRIAQDAIARANLINELKNQVPESELTPEYLAQAIFMGRTRSSKNLDIVSAEEISLGALQDWTRQLSGSLEKAGPEVKAFFDAMTNSQRGNLSEALQLMLLKEIRGEDTGSVAAKSLLRSGVKVRIRRNANSMTTALILPLATTGVCQTMIHANLYPAPAVMNGSPLCQLANAPLQRYYAVSRR